MADTSPAKEPTKPADAAKAPPVVGGGDAGKLRKAGQGVAGAAGRAAMWSWENRGYAKKAVNLVDPGSETSVWYKIYGAGARLTNYGFPRAEIVLVLLGMIKFLLDIFGVVDKTGTASIILSTFLLLFTSIAVLNGEGFILAVAVLTYLNRYGFPLNPEFLRIGIPLVILGAFAFGVRSVIGPRLLPALLIYFYDIGAYDFLITSIGYTVPETMSYYIRIMPWWLILGLVYIDIEQYKNKGFAIFIKTVGIGIIFLTVVGNFVPSVGFAQTPSIQKFQEARVQVEGQLPKGEHPALSQGYCILTEYQNIDACVKRRQAESKCKPFKETDLEAYQECIDIAQGKKQDAQVIGVDDEEPTSFSIDRGEEYLDKIENYDKVPLLLHVKNPRFQRLNFDITCTYEFGTQKIEGIPLVYTTEEELPEPFGFDCTSSQELPSGSGKWVVKVTAHGLTTTVKLSRFFIGDDPKKVVNNIARDFFGASDVAGTATSRAAQPRGPSDPARLDFIVGQPPKSPIIKTEDPQLIATIKNRGNGELLSIARADIAMDAQHFTPGPDCKLQQQGTVLVNPSLTLNGREKLREIRFAVCNLVMSETYRFPELPLPQLFISTLTYDYRITKEFPITVYQPNVPGGLT